MTTCPSCSGRKGGEGFMCGPGGDRYGFIPCGDCKATGEVSEEHARRYAVGKQMRDERVHVRRISQREEATRLGVSMSEWSRLEHGREPETDAGRKAWELRLAEIERAGEAESENR